MGLAVLIPLTSALILGSWCLWFQRHRDLYNFRNEVLHRLESQLGMYHFLRVAEAHLASCDPERYASATADLADVSHRAGHADRAPLFSGLKLAGPSGVTIVRALAIGIPIIQFTILRVLSVDSRVHVIKTLLVVVAVCVAGVAMYFALTPTRKARVSKRRRSSHRDTEAQR